jgi:hypothetical protein
MEPKDRVGWLKNSGQIEFNENLITGLASLIETILSAYGVASFLFAMEVVQ